ncbi:MAG: hypothetical protein RIC55_17040 [Pirellulaceae bacterium]
MSEAKRWWRFSTKTGLLAMLVAGAFFAGYAAAIRRAEEAEMKAESDRAAWANRIARLTNIKLYRDEFAADLQVKVGDLPTPDTKHLKSLGVDLNRLPYVVEYLGLSGLYQRRRYALSPHYALTVDAAFGGIAVHPEDQGTTWIFREWVHEGDRALIKALPGNADVAN